MNHKKYIYPAAILVLAISSSFLTGNEDYQNKAILGIHNIIIRDGIDKKEAQLYLENEWLTLFYKTPGMNASIGVIDRGEESADFVVIYEFDSKWTRDTYYPSDGEYGEKIKQIISENQSIYDKFFKYFQKEKYTHVNYIITAKSK